MACIVYVATVRLYLEDGVWLTESKIQRGASSSDELSEPISLSDPPDFDEESVEMSPEEVSSESLLILMIMAAKFL